MRCPRPPHTHQETPGKQKSTKEVQEFGKKGVHGRADAQSCQFSRVCLQWETEVGNTRGDSVDRLLSAGGLVTWPPGGFCFLLCDMSWVEAGWFSGKEGRLPHYSCVTLGKLPKVSEPASSLVKWP